MRLEQTHAGLRTEVGRMADELEAKAREVDMKNELAELGQVAMSVAHELRDELAGATLEVGLLKRRLSEGLPTLDVVAKLETALATVNAALGDLLSFAAGRQPNLEWVDVRQVVDHVWTTLERQIAVHGVQTVTDVPPRVRALVDREMLHSALSKLALDALEAMPRGGRLTVTSYLGANGLELEVADSGPGLNDEVRRRAFEPFFTTKTGAHGLGLAVVHRLAEAHGGDVVATNCPEGGAAFTLRFPLRLRVPRPELRWRLDTTRCRPNQASLLTDGSSRANVPAGCRNAAVDDAHGPGGGCRGAGRGRSQPGIPGKLASGRNGRLATG